MLFLDSRLIKHAYLKPMTIHETKAWGEWLTEAYSLEEYREYLETLSAVLDPEEVEELIDRATEQANDWGWND
jgi:hypothetical protein